MKPDTGPAATMGERVEAVFSRVAQPVVDDVIAQPRLGEETEPAAVIEQPNSAPASQDSGQPHVMPASDVPPASVEDKGDEAVGREEEYEPPASSIAIAEFTRKDDIVPQPRVLGSFQDLFAFARKPVVAESKEDVSLWSPVTYKPGTSRAQEYKAEDCIETVNAAVFEVDHLPLNKVDAFLERLARTGLKFFVYTTPRTEAAARTVRAKTTPTSAWSSY